MASPRTTIHQALLLLAFTGCKFTVEGGEDGGETDLSNCEPAPEIPYDGIDQDCNGSDLTDTDGDGVHAEQAGGTDCDDQDPDIHPYAQEICNGIDDDCDGLVDGQDEDALDATTWYMDSDDDGHGDASATMSACSQPAGYVADATDCDDGDAAVNPDAAEICNQTDDDCDGLTDGQDDSLSDGADWCQDADGDGYGNAAMTDHRCSQPSGYVEDCTDCDDQDADVTSCQDPDTGSSECGTVFSHLDLTGAVNTDHSNGPWTDNPSESFDVEPGIHQWTVADGCAVPFEIIDPDMNGSESMIATKGGEDWRPSYSFPESFTIEGDGVSGSRLYIAGLASGWSDPSLFAGVAATFTITFSDGSEQLIDLENGVNMDDWNHTWHSVSDPNAVRVYVDKTYGRHIDALTVELDSTEAIDHITVLDDSTVHTGTAEKTSLAIFAVTVEP